MPKHCLLDRTLMIALYLGAQLDHYRIEGVTARSGMASIFRSTDLRTGRRVAIKVPHPEMERDEMFSRSFRREEQIGKLLDHPGVTKVIGNDDRSQFYMVMEWIEGPTLRQILKNHKKLPVEQAVSIAREICAALDYIHAKGLVHCDLKPENIMIDAEGHIKIIDFGIAVSTAVEAETQPSTTDQTYKVMGSPDYISPEQVKGEPGDARSDLYALGLILYEMLTGKTPFRGSNRSAIMKDRLVSHPVPPREIDSGISPQLQEVIYRAIARDPNNRYANAREFASDLDHLDKVEVTGRAELQEWKRRPEPWPQKILFYAAVTMVPVIIFTLLFYAVRWFAADGVLARSSLAR